MPLQLYYQQRFGFLPGDFPAAEQRYDQTMTIPLHPGMHDVGVSRVVTALHEVIR